MNKPFTEEEKQFILDNFHSMTLRQLAQELNRSEGGVKTWTLRLGLRRNNRFDWTEEKVEILVCLYPDHSAKEIARRLNTNDYIIYKKAERLKLKKSPEYLAALNKRMGENLIKNGYGQRFQKGHQPWCAGKKIGSHPNSRKTQFKKGHKPHNHCEIGAIRKPADYWKIKVAEPNFWEFLHLHNWVKTHGEVPENMCISFIDGDIDNCAVENLECISRAELLKKHWVHNLPEDLRGVIYMVGALKRKINRKEKKLYEK